MVRARAAAAAGRRLLVLVALLAALRARESRAARRAAPRAGVPAGSGLAAPQLDPGFGPVWDASDVAVGDGDFSSPLDPGFEPGVLPSVSEPGETLHDGKYAFFPKHRGVAGERSTDAAEPKDVQKHRMVLTTTVLSILLAGTVLCCLVTWLLRKRRRFRYPTTPTQRQGARHHGGCTPLARHPGISTGLAQPGGYWGPELRPSESVHTAGLLHSWQVQALLRPVSHSQCVLNSRLSLQAPPRSPGIRTRHPQPPLAPRQPAQPAHPPRCPGELDPTPTAAPHTWKTSPPALAPQRAGPLTREQPPTSSTPTEALTAPQHCPSCVQCCPAPSKTTSPPPWPPAHISHQPHCNQLEPAETWVGILVQLLKQPRII
ncbi:uncharacterized protein [Struthio camelus]|uniref:uncharacterized protein n=1 Tax=Struthio camelus TaxID=8801 RepID=UPI0036042537